MELRWMELRKCKQFYSNRKFFLIKQKSFSPQEWIILMTCQTMKLILRNLFLPSKSRILQFNAKVSFQIFLHVDGSVSWVLLQHRLEKRYNPFFDALLCPSVLLPVPQVWTLINVFYCKCFGLSYWGSMQFQVQYLSFLWSHSAVTFVSSQICTQSSL